MSGFSDLIEKPIDLAVLFLGGWLAFTLGPDLREAGRRGLGAAAVCVGCIAVFVGVFGLRFGWWSILLE